MSKIEKAVRERDMPTLNAIVDHMRFQMGMNYKKTLHFFMEHSEINDEREFDQLMYELDDWRPL